MLESYLEPQRRHIESLHSTVQTARFGAGAVHETGPRARGQGIHKALIITDEQFHRSEVAHVIEASLAAEGIGHEIVSSATPTPIQTDVERAAGFLRDKRCDGVVSLGGGSVQDVGKCVALLGGSEGTLRGFAHGTDAVRDVLPQVAIPTTAGTGAERSAYAFITELHGREHLVIHDPALVPEVAIIDPVIQSTMPKTLTAATGLNALASAVEAYLSPRHSKTSDQDALEAMQLIAKSLPRAYQRGDDLDARRDMARASYLAGSAFEVAGLGIGDSISLVLSSIFNMGHSTSKAIILPHVMGFEALQVTGRLDGIARAMGHHEPPRGEQHPAVAAVMDLKREVGLTDTLRDHGLGWDDIYLVSRSILHHPFSDRGPRALDEDGLVEILISAMEHDRVPLRRTAATTPHGGSSPPAGQSL